LIEDIKNCVESYKSELTFTVGRSLGDTATNWFCNDSTFAYKKFYIIYTKSYTLY